MKTEVNKVYKNNLKLINNLSPTFCETVNKLVAYTTRICKTKNGKYNIIKNFNGKDLFIHSNYNPVEQAKAISEFAFEEKSDIIFIFGLGLGYELKEMIKKDYKKNYFIVEPDKDVYKTMLETIDIKFMTKHNLTFILNDDPNSIANDFNNFIIKNHTTNVRFVILPSYQCIYNELISRMFDEIKKVMLVFKGGFSTTFGTAKQWSLNYSNNLQYLYETEPISNLYKAFEGVPAVIIGAGPSVEENIEHLKKIYNKALIITGGSGMSVAENNNIKCHIAGVMDGWSDIEKIYKNLELNKDINLFYSTQVYSEIPKMVNGHKFLLNQVEADHFINKKMKWDFWNQFSGPSITNVLAYHLAKLGCDPIIFVGQDLCYSKAKLYAKGAAYEERKPEQITTGFIASNDVQGHEVYTDKSFMNMKICMESAIKLNQSTKYLNGTKYGLHIEGTEDIDFNDYVDNVLLKGKDYNIQSIIDEKYSNKDRDDKEEKINTFINEMKKDVEECLEIFADILSIIDSEKTKDEKEKYVLKKEKKLEKNEFFTDFIQLIFNNMLNLMFKEREFFDMKKQIYCFYYDKCNSMNNNIQITLYEMIQ